MQVIGYLCVTTYPEVLEKRKTIVRFRTVTVHYRTANKTSKSIIYLFTVFYGFWFHLCPNWHDWL